MQKESIKMSAHRNSINKTEVIEFKKVDSNPKKNRFIKEKTFSVEETKIKKSEEGNETMVITKDLSPVAAAAVKVEETWTEPPVVVEDSGRERLKRHRVEVAGRVWIPDIWGQEDLLKDWIDCTAFDASLMNNNIMTARASLAEEGRRTNSSRLRIENSC